MIGVLALQGDFERHFSRLAELGEKSLLVTKPEELSAIDGLVLPGGESSALLKLCGEDFRNELKKRVENGLPVLATCAGLILLAHGVENPQQESLDVIDVDVARNAYGRQLDSFIDPSLAWTEAGKDALAKLTLSKNGSASQTVEGVFIRAPRIRRVGDQVSVLIERQGEPVMVRQGNVLGATFHPELSPGAKSVHALFVSLCRKDSGAVRH